MKNPVLSEPIFEEVEAPVYTIQECNDAISVAINCMMDTYKNGMITSELEEYISRFPFIRHDTAEHILNVVTSNLAING